MAEQNLSQSRAVFEGFLTFTRNALRSIDQQSSAICEHSMAIAEQTLSIAFEFAHKAIRAREPRNSPKSRANSLAGRGEKTPPLCSPNRFQKKGPPSSQALACSLSAKVQSSQANTGLYASGARPNHLVIVGWSTRNRPLIPAHQIYSLMHAPCRMASRSSRRNLVVTA
jgi:hypothetical protein